MKKLFLSFLLVSQFAYAITGNSVWRIPSGASLPTWGPVNLADATNAVTGILPKANLPSLGQQLSSSSASFTTSSTSYVDVTNLTVTITTTGQPVMLMLQSDGSGTQSYLAASKTSTCSADIRFVRASSEVGSYHFGNDAAPASSGWIIPSSSAQFVDVIGAGTYTYKIQAKITSGTANMNVINTKLLAYEL